MYVRVVKNKSKIKQPNDTTWKPRGIFAFENKNCELINVKKPQQHQ